MKVELGANEIQSMLIAFVDVPPSAQGNSVHYYKLFFLNIVIYFSFGSVCVYVSYIYHFVDYALW